MSREKLGKVATMALRLTPDEMIAITKAAAKAGMSRNDYVREGALLHAGEKRMAKRVAETAAPTPEMAR
jgi:uncharacterized protein (DUF1778 family)